jgi:hypothetical protein
MTDTLHLTTPVTLQEFSPATMQTARSSVIIGKRNTGKTTLIKDLISKTCADIPHGTIITPTDKLLYEGVVPAEQLHESYSADTVLEVLKRQTNIEIEDRRAYFVLDNCMYDTSWTKDPMLLSLVLFTQSYHLTVFLSMAYALAMQPTMRDNIDYVFIFREPIEQNRKRLYEFYGGMFPSYDVFCAVLDAYTIDHTCLVIDNTTQSTRLKDRVFYYKAST